MNNNKNVKLLSQKFININLKAHQQVKKIKKHHLILKIIILSLKNRFLFIIFNYPHFIISIYEIELCKVLNLT